MNGRSIRFYLLAMMYLISPLVGEIHAFAGLPDTNQFILSQSPSSDNLNTVHGAKGQVWAVGGGSVLRWNGQKWNSVSVPLTNAHDGAGCTDTSTGPSSFRGLWVNSSSDVWVGCDIESDNTGAAHWDGQSWTYFPLLANRSVNSFWSSGTNNLWGIEGDFYEGTELNPGSVAGYIGHSPDAKSWQKIGGDMAANGIWGDGSGGLWTLCYGTSICVDSEAKMLASTPGDSEAALHVHQYDGQVALYGIWGSGPKDIWVVGNAATVLHYDGNSWNEVSVPGASIDLRGISGTDKNNIWAVGDKGTILRFNGSSWKPVSRPTTAMLRSVWVDSQGNVWIVGDGGVILRSPSANDRLSARTKK